MDIDCAVCKDAAMYVDRGHLRTKNSSRVQISLIGAILVICFIPIDNDDLKAKEDSEQRAKLKGP